MAFEEFGQLSKRRREERTVFKKKIIIVVIISLILIGCIAGGVFAFLHFKEKSSKNNEGTQSKGQGQEDQRARAANKIVQMMCDPADYKQKCEEVVSKAVHVQGSAPSIAPKEIIKGAIDAASEHVIMAVNKTSTFTFDKDEEKAAYNVCKTVLQDSIDELAESLSRTGHEMNDFKAKIADLKTWLSAVYSYQETCIDAFPEGETKTKIKEAVKDAEEYLSNSLALATQIKAILQKYQEAAKGDQEEAKHRRLLPDPDQLVPRGGGSKLVDEEGFPEWVGRHERKLLIKATENLTADITVAKDGSGNYTTINECLENLPENRTERLYIYVKEGVYEEYVTITKKMVNITMYGDGSQKTTVMGNKNYADGTPIFQTATFAVLGEGFIGIGMGFKNIAGPQKHQAVALRVQADRAIFVNCRMDAYQGSLYAQAHRQFYRTCFITGTIDFIFGDASAIFQNCMIVVKKPMQNQNNIITAQGRADKHENTGFVLHNCRILPDESLEPDRFKVKTYLGRPWKEYSRTIIMETLIGDLVQPQGWLPWQGDFALKTLYYAEFNNHGPGSDLSKRVSWAGYKKKISRQEAQGYTIIPFLQGDWIQRAKNVPIHLGLYN